jgi:hypothetical protein
MMMMMLLRIPARPLLFFSHMLCFITSWLSLHPALSPHVPFTILPGPLFLPGPLQMVHSSR